MLRDDATLYLVIAMVIIYCLTITNCRDDLRYQILCDRRVIDYPLNFTVISSLLSQKQLFWPRLDRIEDTDYSYAQLKLACVKEKTDPNCAFKVRDSFSYLAVESKESRKFLEAKSHDEYDASDPEIRAFAVGMCMSACTSLFKLRDKTEYNFHCPAPCTFQSICPEADCVNEGLFGHQFKCECRGGLVWDAYSLTCQPEELIKLRSQGKTQPDLLNRTECLLEHGCDNEGTEFCGLNIDNPTIPPCLCKPNYAGKQCNQPTNPCTDLQREAQGTLALVPIAGDEACNTAYSGNQCVVVDSGSRQFTCECNNPFWLPDDSRPYPNCLRRRSSCDSRICLHGRCIQSEDGSLSKCHCDTGFSGLTCSQWTGVWSNWEPWEKCRPSCGSVRISVRVRECVSIHDDKAYRSECVGPEIDYFNCSQRPCLQTGGGDFFSSYLAIREWRVSSIPAIATSVALVLMAIWLVLFWGIVARFTRAVLLAIIRKFKELHREVALD